MYLVIGLGEISESCDVIERLRCGGRKYLINGTVQEVQIVPDRTKAKVTAGGLMWVGAVEMRKWVHFRSKVSKIFSVQSGSITSNDRSMMATSALKTRIADGNDLII